MRAIVDKICEFIREKVREAGAKGAVVGVSGGVDSACTIALCSRALGRSGVIALIMPDGEITPESEVADAREIATKHAGKTYEIDIAKILRAYTRAIPVFNERDKVALGNLRARIRKDILYYFANSMGLLVVGTGDKSEALLTYFTKHGDGGVDILPIGDLYKTEVRELARFLGVPPHITNKPSTPTLWRGHTLEEEFMGMSYEQIDPILRKLFEEGRSPNMVAQELKVPVKKVLHLISMHRRGRHKLDMPPVCVLSPYPTLKLVERFRRKRWGR